MNFTRTLIGLLSVMSFSAYSSAQNYELVWSDEFNATSLDRSVWNYETGTGPQNDGWGNWEEQYYTDREDNVRLSDGKLVITCKKENYGGKSYTSGRIQTRNKVMFKYGKIESLIKVPAGKAGVWPAFWLLGTGHGGNWPYCGEIDIMEMMCKADASTWKEALATYHWNTKGINGDYSHGQHGDAYNVGEELGAKWRIYGLEWTPEIMTGYVCDKDGKNRKNICSLDISSRTGGMEAFTDYEFYIVYNFAFGGTYVNGEIDGSFVSDDMQVDWVKVYQDVENQPLSTISVGDFATKANTDYVKILTEKELNGSVLDMSAMPFNIWSGTMKADEGATGAFEGDGMIAVENCGSTWYGGGFYYSGNPIDFSYLKDYYLHFALKTNSTEPFELSFNKSSKTITPEVADEWVEYVLPISTTFPSASLGVLSVFEPFSFNQVAGTTMSGRTFHFDDIYLYKPGGSTSPNLVVSEQQGKLKDTNATAKISVSGSHLTKDVNISLSNSRDFSVTPSVLHPVNGVVNAEVTVKFIGTKTSASKVTVSSGDIKALTNVASSITGVERLTTDYIVLSRETDVEGSFRDWSTQTFNLWAQGSTLTVEGTDGVEPFEGESCMALKVNYGGWYGGGFVVSQKLDYEYINRYNLHFAYYASNTQPTTVRAFGADITVVPSKANTWQEFDIPMSQFNLSLDVLSSVEPFSFCQGTNEAIEVGKVIAFDDVYYYIPGGSGVASLSATSQVVIDTRYNTTGNIHLSGSSLGSQSKVVLTCSNPSFTLSATSIDVVGGKVSKDVTVTYTGTGIEYATVVAQCGSLVQQIAVSSFSDVASSSSCNLITGLTDGGRYYAHTWEWQTLTGSTTTINGQSAKFFMPSATTTQHQAQFWLTPATSLDLTPGTLYSAKATLVSDKDVTLTFKVVEHADNATAFVEKVISMRAGVATSIDYTDYATEGMTNLSLYFDFGGNQANTTVNLYNVEVGTAECYGDEIHESGNENNNEGNETGEPSGNEGNNEGNETGEPSGNENNNEENEGNETGEPSGNEGNNEGNETGEPLGNEENNEGNETEEPSETTPTPVILTAGGNSISYVATTDGNGLYRIVITGVGLQGLGGSYVHVNGEGTYYLNGDHCAVSADNTTITIDITSTTDPQLYTPLYVLMPGEVNFGTPHFDYQLADMSNNEEGNNEEGSNEEGNNEGENEGEEESGTSSNVLTLTSGTHTIKVTPTTDGNGNYRIVISGDGIVGLGGSYCYQNGLAGYYLNGNHSVVSSDKKSVTVELESTQDPQLYTPLYVLFDGYGEVNFGFITLVYDIVSPASGSTSILYPDVFGMANVYDITGRVVKANVDIDEATNGLGRGAYIIKTNTTAKKLIIR